MIELKNKVMQLKFTKLGAELKSLVFNNFETIWQAKSDWQRSAPVLFPIVGRLNQNTYTYKDKKYTLPQHGFARDMEFILVKHSDSEITFSLQANNQTKLIYPFDFELVISYKLIDNTLGVNYLVKNISPHNKMFFSIGAHPGFNVNFQTSYLEIDTKQLNASILLNGLLINQKNQINIYNNKLQLSTNLFNNDAIVLEDSQIHNLKLVTDNYAIKMECVNWPYFGIWSKNNCNNFICLEPWFGITDIENFNDDFSKKKGVICLKQNQSFNCSYTLIYSKN
ncbi:MAG: aldose 1-epimerase family protein [Bacteroidetes bacterium]|nr:aldose 1-epimerase family protein [Bacteroidota bacterium]